MHNFSRVFVAVMLSAGLAGAQEYETRTFTSREEFSSQRTESGWQQQLCDSQGNCTMQYQSSMQSRDLHTYWEQRSNWPTFTTVPRWRPR